MAQALLRVAAVKKELPDKNGIWTVSGSTKDDINYVRQELQKKFGLKDYLFAAKRMVLGLLYHIGRVLGLNKNPVSVLCFHSISGADNNFAVDIRVFEKQMEKISKHARFIGLDEIMEVLSGKKFSTPAVAITFDDGYRDIMKILPVTKKYNIPVAVFAISDKDKVNKKELDNNAGLLDDADLRNLHSEGWIIGCHSATHANLKNLSGKKIRREIINSKKTLEERLGFKVEYFAYPKGFFDKRIISTVRCAGYKAAFSILPGCVNSRSNRWILPRTIIEKNHKVSEFPAVYSPTSFLVRRLTDRFNLWNRISKI